MNEAQTRVEGSVTLSQIATREYEEAKRELLQMDHLPELSEFIQDRSLQFYGVVSCAASYANFLFVGNSQGYIRVFDLQAKQVKDLKPLYDR